MHLPKALSSYTVHVMPKVVKISTLLLHHHQLDLSDEIHTVDFASDK